MTTVLLRLIRLGARTVVLLGFAAGVVVLLLWLAGKFSPKVPVRKTTDHSHVSDVEGRLV